MSQDSYGQQLCRAHGIEDVEMLKRLNDFIYSTGDPHRAYCELNRLLADNRKGDAVKAMETFKKALIASSLKPVEGGKHTKARAQRAKAKLKKRRAKKGK